MECVGASASFLTTVVFTPPLSLSAPTVPTFSWSWHTELDLVWPTSAPLGTYSTSILMPTALALPLSLLALTALPSLHLQSSGLNSDLELDLHKTLPGSR